ncbi:LUD domain-containing protein [Candidatus Gottesmanbacteria bacterium]|nr:LUD domain-containing protein [Candidatus Gottesmanbacteria bacterium]
MTQWDKLADDATIGKTASSLRANNIAVEVVATGEEAKTKALEIIPQGAEVHTATSMTTDTIGLAAEINESGRYTSIRKKLMSMDRSIQGQEMARLRGAPDWVVGSVHAVTLDGHVLIASQSGSQLPAAASGAAHVLWIVGTQKIVENLDEGMKRMYEYCLPLEEARAQKAYGVGSAVNKILIINKEIAPGRITMILVKEKLGF